LAKFISRQNKKKVFLNIINKREKSKKHKKEG